MTMLNKIYIYSFSVCMKLLHFRIPNVAVNLQGYSMPKLTE
ncbi:unnamed protein product [Arabidopsis halleri]